LTAERGPSATRQSWKRLELLHAAPRSSRLVVLGNTTTGGIEMRHKVHVEVEDIVALLEDSVLDVRRGDVPYVSGVATLVPGADEALSFAGGRSTAQDLSDSGSSLLLVHPGISLPE